MPNKYLLSIIITTLFSFQAYSQCTNNVNLNTWIQEGDPTTGNWQVDGIGSTVTQTINFFGVNAKPTFFVSPDSFMNVKITGSIRVDPSGFDDDWIGFVFGYHSPVGDTNYHKTWLFDWKKTAQNLFGFPSQEGKALVKIDGIIPDTSYSKYFYSHVSDPIFTVVDSSYGLNTGWEHNITYDFTLIYTATRAIIMIDNDTIFDVVDCFELGRFGFYNHSQAEVIYSNFSYELISNFETLTPVVCPGDTAVFLFEDVSCGGLGQGSANIASWRWNFGDGDTSNLINPVHIYNTAGLYNVEMIVTDILGCIDTVIKPVVVLPVPNVNLGSDTTLCIGDTLGLDGTAGFPLATYQWQDNSIDSTFTVNSPGTYWVEATSFCGSDRDSIDVNYLSTPTPIGLGADTMMCNGNFLTLDATQPFSTYSWQNGANTPSFNVDVSGTYSVTVTNICGSISDTINVMYIDAPVAFDLGNDTTFCAGSSLLLDVTQPDVNYLWQDNSNASSFNITSTGVYSVTLANVCGMESDTIDVTVLNAPSPISFGPDTTLCTGAILSLDVTQPDVFYLWHDNSTNPTFDITMPGTYSVVVSNICGQEGDTLNVNYEAPPFAVSLGNDTTLCEATNLLLDVTQAGNVTYLWQDNSTGSTFNVSNTGNYSVTVSNICGTETDDINIDYLSPPQPFSLGRDTMLCEGVTQILDATQANVNYLWQDNSTQANFNVTTPGVYMVTISNACGEEDSDIAIDYIAPPQPVFIGNDTSICEGIDWVLDPKQPNMTYSWQDNSDSSAFVPTTSGFYQVSVSNQCGEENGGVDLEFRPAPKPIVFAADTLVCDEDEFMLDITMNVPGISYLWHDGTTSPTYAVQSSGIIQVRASNDCGVEEAEMQVRQSDCDCTVFMPNAFSPNGDGVNDQFGVAYDCDIETATLLIYNRWGKIVYSSDNIDASWDGTFKGKAQPEGVYAWYLRYMGTELDKQLNIPMRGSVTLIR